MSNINIFKLKTAYYYSKRLRNYSVQIIKKNIEQLLKPTTVWATIIRANFLKQD